MVYREQVPSSLRSEIKGAILKAKMEGHDDLLSVSGLILAHLLAGNIPTAVADSARAYLEFMLAVVTAKLIMEQGSRSGPSELAERLEKARKASKKLIPTIMLTDTGNGPPELDLGLEQGGQPVVLDAPWQETT